VFERATGRATGRRTEGTTTISERPARPTLEESRSFAERVRARDRIRANEPTTDLRVATEVQPSVSPGTQTSLAATVDAQLQETTAAPAAGPTTTLDMLEEAQRQRVTETQETPYTRRIEDLAVPGEPDTSLDVQGAIEGLREETGTGADLDTATEPGLDTDVRAAVGAEVGLRPVERGLTDAGTRPRTGTRPATDTRADARGRGDVDVTTRSETDIGLDTTPIPIGTTRVPPGPPTQTPPPPPGRPRTPPDPPDVPELPGDGSRDFDRDDEDWFEDAIFPSGIAGYEAFLDVESGGDTDETTDSNFGDIMEDFKL
jgi:hypothetical protein